MRRTVKKIGNGSEKVCYRLDDGQVGLVTSLDSKAIHEEHQNLNRLLEAGFPAYKTVVEEIWVHENDMVETALVGREYDGHFLCGPKNVVIRVPEPIRLKAVSIIRRMMDQNLFVSDPQFLFDFAGEVVLCDPGLVVQPKGRAGRDNQRMYAMWAIDGLLGKGR